MTVSEILNLVVGAFGTRYQITQSQALLLLNQVQATAFDKDLDAFKVSDSFQTVTTGSKGPYAFPTNPPVRKFLGVTVHSQGVLNGTAMPSYESDYGFTNPPTQVDSRNMFVPININMFSKTYTFQDVPTDVADHYRIVYYRRAPTILSATDDKNLLIPAEYHHSLCVQATIALANFSIYGKPVPKEALDPYMEPFWESLFGATDSNGSGSISEGLVGL